MLHVRVLSPTALAEQLAGRLAAAPGVQNVVVRAGAARRPDGDAVEFDVRDGAANPVFRALHELGLDRAGVICVERVDAALTGQGAPAGDHGALGQEIAPVWEMVEAAIRQGEAYAPSFYVLLAVAALIGAVGLLTSSSPWPPSRQAYRSRTRAGTKRGDRCCSCCSTSYCSSSSAQPAPRPARDLVQAFALSRPAGV